MRELPRSWVRRRWVRRTVLGLGAAAAAAILLAGTATAVLLGEDSGSVSPLARGTGDDALWLGHAWVDGREGPRDIAALAARLRGTGIRYLFVHDGPLNDDGTLNLALNPRANWLVTAVHRALPGVVVQAWLGDLVGGGHLDLARPATRDNITASAARALADGFDGVHLDLEPVGTGDPGYLALLRQVHAMTHHNGGQLSVAAEQLEPLGGMHLLYDQHWWIPEYLRQVAVTVDEVAVMAYDSGIPASGLYAGYIRKETSLALAAVPPGVTLLIGVPAFHTPDFGHGPAETVGAAIHGVRMALSPVPPRRPFGVALYAGFAATATDWADYLDDWVHPSSH